MNFTKLFHLIQFSKIKSKIGGYSDIDGWLTKSEALGLFKCASSLPSNAVVVEIGTWKGKSTFCIAQGLKSGIINSVDPFDASGEEESAVVYNDKKGDIPLLKQFENRMTELGVRDKIIPRKGLSKDFVGQFPKIDFLFIDGDHSIEGCDFDFKNYSPYLNSGALIAFHDYYKNRDSLGPTWVVHNRVLPSSEFSFVKLYDTLWIGRKVI